MAGQALTAGTGGRRRVLFGLLDGDGWTWASIKAAIWFVIIVMMLGYLPDRAYYFTVFPTIDLGVLVYSPINFCPPSNRTLPCPAPIGATLPWDGSPAEVALPSGGRTDGSAVQLGSKLAYIGGSDGTTASDQTYLTDLYSGTFGAWQPGPALPAPRSGAAVVVLNSSAYVVGGNGPDGKPTDTVYVAAQDLATGVVGAFAADEALKLPGARSSAVLVAAGDGLILIGGTNGTAAQGTVWKATFDKAGKLQPWVPQASLPAGQEVSEASGALIGDFVYIFGGRTAQGPVATVLRGHISKAQGTLGQVVSWDIGGGGTNLPAARTRAAGFSANGALYLVGGADDAGPRQQFYWTVPDAKGDLTGWQHLDATDLPIGLAGGSAVVSGSEAFIIGGTTVDQPAVAGAARANLAPQPPFFQLGLFGATVPALKVGEEIGQQLGYLSAAGVGTVNFILLLLIGWALAHKERSREMLGRVVRRLRR
ncbi:MAG: Kelch repeat-containing protein [Candidatus Limnocylindrales bacterium]